MMFAATQNRIKDKLIVTFPGLYRRYKTTQMVLENNPRHYVFSEEWSDPPRYSQDGLTTAHNCDFLKDPKFMAAYAVGEKTNSWNGSQPIYRAYVAAWAAARGKNLEGDFVECGVNKGALSRMIVEYIGFGNLDKTFYLLDTYKGFDSSTLTEFERKKHALSTLHECYDDVVNTFKPFKNVKVIRGTVPGTLSQVPSTKIAYLSIDMNCALPERAAIEYFWDKLVPGAMVVLDDYGWRNHEEQKDAHDDFAKSKGTSVLSLPTGQGILIK
jgi:O-methyltransferase